jgi:hypothetical protein
MARRKNTKFIDPRYFMDEKMERLDEGYSGFNRDDPKVRQAQDTVDTMERDARAKGDALKGASETFKQMLAPQYHKLRDELLTRDGTWKFLEGYEKMLKYMSTTQQRPHQARIRPSDLEKWMNNDPEILKLLDMQ